MRRSTARQTLPQKQSSSAAWCSLLQQQPSHQKVYNHLKPCHDFQMHTAMRVYTYGT